MARSSKLTPELEKRICDAIATGCTLEEAAESAGICSKTLHRWMKRGECERVGVHRAFYLAVRRVLLATRKALLNVVRRASRYDAHAAMYLLSRTHGGPGPSKGGHRRLDKVLSRLLAETDSTLLRDAEPAGDQPVSNDIADDAALRRGA